MNATDVGGSGAFTSGVRVPGVAAGEFAKEAVESVDSADFWQEHERTLAGDDADAVLTAEGDSFVADGALTTGAMHPDTLDA